MADHETVTDDQLASAIQFMEIAVDMDNRFGNETDGATAHCHRLVLDSIRSYRNSRERFRAQDEAPGKARALALKAMEHRPGLLQGYVCAAGLLTLLGAPAPAVPPAVPVAGWEIVEVEKVQGWRNKTRLRSLWVDADPGLYYLVPVPAPPCTPDCHPFASGRDGQPCTCGERVLHNDEGRMTAETVPAPEGVDGDE